LPAALLHNDHVSIPCIAWILGGHYSNSFTCLLDLDLDLDLGLGLVARSSVFLTFVMSQVKGIVGGDLIVIYRLLHL
jgi:hypothetical protein